LCLTEKAKIQRDPEGIYVRRLAATSFPILFMTNEEHEPHDRDAEKSIKEIVEKYGWYVACFRRPAGASGFS
jgi:hypothetical protein